MAALLHAHRHDLFQLKGVVIEGQRSDSRLGHCRCLHCYTVIHRIRYDCTPEVRSTQASILGSHDKSVRSPLAHSRRQHPILNNIYFTIDWTGG